MPNTRRSKKVVQNDFKWSYNALIRCPVRKAHQDGRDPKREDYMRKCGSAACPYCGNGYMWHWAANHRLKGAVVQDETIEFTLIWSDVKIHSDSTDSIIKYFESLERFVETINSRLKEYHIEVFMITSHFNPPPKGGMAIARAHAHLACAGSCSRGLKKRINLYKKLVCDWKSLGGESVHLELPDNNDFDSFLDYADKHPLKDFSYEEMVHLHKSLLCHVEKLRNRPAIFKAVGGPLFSPNGFLRLRAGLRFKLVHDILTLKGRCLDSDRSVVIPANDLKTLRFAEKCPKCNRINQKIVEKRGELICAAIGCNHTWIPEPVLQGETDALAIKRQHRRVIRDFLAGKSIEALSEAFDMEPLSIRVIIETWRMKTKKQAP